MPGRIAKQFLKGGKPIMHTIQAFQTYDYRVRIIVVLPEGYKPWEQLRDEYQFSVNHKIAYGGETRFHSVKNGLSSVR